MLFTDSSVSRDVGGGGGDGGVGGGGGGDSEKDCITWVCVIQRSQCFKLDKLSHW